MKLWLATTLAAILLSVCSAYPYPFDITPGANMELGEEDTTPDMTANAEDQTPDINFESFLDTGVQSLPEVQASCLRTLYVFAFTSGRSGADVGANNGHEIEVKTSRETKSIKLPNIPGTEYRLHKGDVWELSFRNDFRFKYCVTLSNLQHIAIESDSDDGWNIASIMTYVRVKDRSSIREFTRDIDVFRWVDDCCRGNGARRFMLTKVH